MVCPDYSDDLCPTDVIMNCNGFHEVMTDQLWDEDGCQYCNCINAFANFNGIFGGALVTNNIYEIPAGSELWAGYANLNTAEKR